MPEVDWEAVVAYVKDRSADPQLRAWMSALLVELCGIDNTPARDAARASTSEAAVFDIIERELRAACGDRVDLSRVPIDPAIESDPYYTAPHHMADEAGRVPSAAEAFADRCNLVAAFGGDASAGLPVVYNAHVDTVASYVPPRAEGDVVHGRGSADDKGPVAALILQARLIAEIEDRFGLGVGRPRAYQFVIEEETGGNGSLSLAKDPRWADWPVVVSEPSGNVPSPANRGAFWFRIELAGPEGQSPGPAGAIPYIVLEMEREGRKIRQESDHPLFEPNHVLTNYGVLGPYGQGPSTVSEHVAMVLGVRASANPDRVRIRLIEVLDAGLARYVEEYGDKTAQTDPATGEPKVARHYTLTDQSERDYLRYRLDVHGKAGHMGAIRECDNAVIKLAYAMDGVLRLAAQFPGLEPAAWLADLPPEQQNTIVLEGGQGFVPTHEMADLQARLSAAARKGVIRYLDAQGLSHDLMAPHFSCDTLHNEAYACDPQCAPMRAFDRVFDLWGRLRPERRGWRSSCDARIFARDGRDVIVFGPGQLQHAHADDERIDLGEVAEAGAMGAVAALVLGGTA